MKSRERRQQRLMVPKCEDEQITCQGNVEGSVGQIVRNGVFDREEADTAAGERVKPVVGLSSGGRGVLRVRHPKLLEDGVGLEDFELRE